MWTLLQFKFRKHVKATPGKPGSGSCSSGAQGEDVVLEVPLGTMVRDGDTGEYLFEVTERFGMEARTELILLQRTMVVVEGVARSLDPHMNIWQVSQPIVENYIKESIGPKALMKDLGKTLMVLSRFGPQLPAMAEAALIKANNPPPPPKPQRRKARLAWFSLGVVVAVAAVLGIQNAL